MRVIDCPHCGKSKTVKRPDQRILVNVFSTLPDLDVVPAPHRKVTEFCGKCGETFLVCWFYSKS